jgi:hypothetical protein
MGSTRPFSSDRANPQEDDAMKNRYARKLSPWLVFSLGWFGAGTAFGKDVGPAPKNGAGRERGAIATEDAASTDESNSATRHSATSGSATSSSSAKAGKDAAASGETQAQPSQATEGQSSTAAAAGPGSSIPVSVALLGSFGVNSEHTRGGIGARAGLHLEGVLPYYVGGLATYFFGLEERSKDPFGTGTSSVSRSFMYVSAEVGLELSPIRYLTIRPYFGVGLGRAHEETCSDSRGCLDETQYPVTLSPAVLGLYELGSGFFAGGDVRFLIAAGAGQVSGPVLSGTVGIKF